MMPSSSTQWHRSSYSNGMGGECVEVATMAGQIAVRDSKSTSRQHLILSPSAWQNFTMALAQRSTSSASSS
ncbi:DUF397 domain-containing protein [Streptomyces sp. NPDC051684]|uniref:DUF397 domain-containing protein n=1 Tax=Streptomyces sp. NPDC051684 TaxID=3365670 RepID=UPI00378C0407